MKRYAAGLATGLLLLVAVGKAAELTPAQTRVFKHRLHKSETVVNWWNHRGRWALFPRYDKCWQVRVSVRHRRICRLARSSLAAHSARIARLEKLLYLPASPPPFYPPYSDGGGSSWLVEAFLCIHQYEGAWNSNTGNGYYGGLQMDYGFMRSYGAAYLARYGTADRWPPAAQIEVAMRAYSSGRGFGPWPNAARLCGLA